MEFEHSREENIQSLIENENFERVCVIGTAKKYVFVDRGSLTQLKPWQSDSVQKPTGSTSYGQKDAATIENKALTVQQFTQRLMLSLMAYPKTLSCHTWDGTQAYMHSATSLEQDTYIRPPLEMDFTRKDTEGSKALIWNSGVGSSLVFHLHGVPYWKAWNVTIKSWSLSTTRTWWRRMRRHGRFPRLW